MTLLLMAAGSGSRYGKLKQFDALGPKEEFLMEFGIYDAIQSNFKSIVAVTKKENVDFLKEHLTARLPEHIKVDVVAQELSDIPEGSTYSGERLKPWGTAHAVWSARNVIDGPFAVLNADDFYGGRAYKKASEFIAENPSNNTFGLVGYTLKDTLSLHGSVSRGICTMDNSNTLLSVKEHTKLEQKGDGVIDLDSSNEFTGEELVSMNFWVCRPTIFDNIEEDLKAFLKDENNIAKGELYLPAVIQKMVENNKTSVKVIPSESSWFGVTYASDKDTTVEKLNEMTEQKEYPSPLWN